MEITKKEDILINNIIEKLKHGLSSNFIDPSEEKKIISILNKLKINYEIYIPFTGAINHIIYKNELPDISILKVKNDDFTHQDVMGSFFSLGLNKNIIGDIVLLNDYIYILVISSHKDYLIQNFTKIKNKNIEFISVGLSILDDLKINVEELEIIISSNRIDNVISKLIHVNRKEIDKLISKKEIILNYEILKNSSYKLKENDIFSIRRYGKYKYIGTIKTTKKDNLIVKIEKFV